MPDIPPSREVPSPGAESPVDRLATANDAAVGAALDALMRDGGFRRLQRLGFHLQRNDFYSPLNDCDFLDANRDLWEMPPLVPAAIDWRIDAQLALAREVSGFLSELTDVPPDAPADGSHFGWTNHFWEGADAMVHYGLVRVRRPSRYVEVGCGWSSLLLARALQRNAAEGHPCVVTLVEPYPRETIFAHLPADWQHHRSILQRTDPAVFDALGAGDILFYDGSHCAKVASDVTWFFFRVLPRLKPGVIVHLHDIALPHDYPPPWIFERGQTWNEQYVLQAFLMHNTAYRILIANRFLYVHRAQDLEALYTIGQPVWGSSIWIEKVASPSDV